MIHGKLSAGSHFETCKSVDYLMFLNTVFLLSAMQSSSFGHLQDDSDTQDRLLDNVHQARSSLGTYTVGESSMQSVTIPPGRTSLQDVGGHHSRAESAHAGHATATTTVGVAPLMQCQEDLQAFWPSVNEKMKHLVNYTLSVFIFSIICPENTVYLMPHGQFTRPNWRRHDTTMREALCIHF